jgi:hypothetical protein
VQDVLEWRHEVPKLLAAYEALWPGPDARRSPNGVRPFDRARYGRRYF